MNNSFIKEALIEILKKATAEDDEGKYIYFSLKTSSGLVIKTCVKDFEIDKEFEIDKDCNDYISISGYEEKDGDDYEMVRIPLLNIVCINNLYEGKKQEEYDGYEYCITYLDETKLIFTIP